MTGLPRPAPSAPPGGRAAVAGIAVDVAFLPCEARNWPPVVCVVVDQLRASSTITTLLDLGCSELLLTASAEKARSLARDRGSLLVGDRDGRIPPGFDLNNSPARLASAEVRGCSVVLCTTTGTKVLSRFAGMPALLAGCLANARSCAQAALERALSLGVDIGVVCAGERDRFGLEDVLAAGLLLEHLGELSAARGVSCGLTDAAMAAMQLHATCPDVPAALWECAVGRLLIELDAEDDLRACSRVDITQSVPVVHAGPPLQVVAFASGQDESRSQSSRHRPRACPGC